MKLKDLRKHQSSKSPADGYFIKPLDEKLIEDLVSEYQVVEKLLYPSESTSKDEEKNPEDLTFVGADPTLISKIEKNNT